MRRGLCLLLEILFTAGCVVVHPKVERNTEPGGAAPRIRVNGLLDDTKVLQEYWDRTLLEGQQVEHEWIGTLPNGIDWRVPHLLKVVTNRWKRETQVPPPEYLFKDGRYDVYAVIKNETFKSVVFNPCLSCIALPYILVTDGWPCP